jgi:hypothetical protein
MIVGRFHALPALGRSSWVCRAFAVLTSGALVGGLLLPPVHVHLGVHLDADHEGREPSAAIVHQHWGGHEHESSGPEIEYGDHDGREFVLDQHAIVSSGGIADQSVAVSVPIVFLTATLDRDIPIRRIDTTAPPHGPPRRSCSLRGPPSLSI